MNTTYSDIQDNILSLISKSDAATRNRVKTWINLGYQDFVLRELWPFREETGSLNTIAGTQEYSLSSNFSDIDENNIITVSLQGSSARNLTYIPFNQLRTNAPDLDANGSSYPQYFYIKAGNIGLYPAPDSVYTVAIDYYKIPTELSADSDEPIIPLAYREALMQYGLSLEHDYNTDPDLAQKAMNRYEQIVRLAQQNLLVQPNSDGNFHIRGPEDFVSHTGIYGNEVL